MRPCQLITEIHSNRKLSDAQYPGGLTVKTPDFDSGNEGSIPSLGTKCDFLNEGSIAFAPLTPCGLQFPPPETGNVEGLINEPERSFPGHQF